MEGNIENYNITFKICLIGDSKAGKSSLMMRFSDDAFSEQFLPTIGVDFKIRIVDVDNTGVRLQIWDTAGQERFAAITNTYYRSAQGFIIVYDVTNQPSFLHVDKWIQEAEMYCLNRDAYKILVGTKCDLESERQVSYEEGLAKAQQHGIKFMETSAKTSTNVFDVFNLLAFDTLQVVDNESQEISSKKNIDSHLDKRIEKLSSAKNEMVKYAVCC